MMDNCENCREIAKLQKFTARNEMDDDKDLSMYLCDTCRQKIIKNLIFTPYQMLSMWTVKRLVKDNNHGS